MTPAQGLQQLQVALAHHQAGRLDEAERLYKPLRLALPKVFDVWSLSGALALQRNQLDPARDYLLRALRIDPRSGICALRYALTFSLANRHLEALNHFRNALKIDPKNGDIWANLAHSLRATGDIAGAKAAYQSALSHNPKYAEALDHLGALVADTESMAAAIPYFQKAVEINPKLATAWCNLGLTLSHVSKFPEARSALETALKLDPRNSKAWTGLAIIFQNNYRLAEACDAFGRAATLAPTNAEAHSGRLLTLHYLDDITRERLWEEHRAFGRVFDRPSAAPSPPFWDGRRRLRLAFLSPDLRRHSVAYFLEPLLRHLDRTRFEIHLLHDHAIEDDMSARLKALADQWTNLAGQTHAVTEKRIRDARPDIVVDLAGHTGVNRMALLARRLAPVQVGYLGYPDTSGLTAMDFRFTDAVCDPEPEADAFHTEKLVRFSEVAWAYTPPPDAPEPVMTEEGKPVVFGCFNNFAKVSDETLRLWARVLAATEHARLQFKGHDLTQPEIRAGIEARARACGIDPTRLDLLGRTPNIGAHLDCYRAIDVALDPLPYHGTTTTCEALWMGVPVVCLTGDRHVSRVSTSLLRSAGLGAWAAATKDDYVRIAVGLAADRAARMAWRTGLREKLRQAPLMDHAAQARRFGDALLECVALKNR